MRTRPVQARSLCLCPWACRNVVDTSSSRSLVRARLWCVCAYGNGSSRSHRACKRLPEWHCGFLSWPQGVDNFTLACWQRNIEHILWGVHAAQDKGSSDTIKQAAISYLWVSCM